MLPKIYAVDDKCVFCGNRNGKIYHSQSARKSVHLTCLIGRYDNDKEDKLVIRMMKAFKLETPALAPSVDTAKNTDMSSDKNV